MNPVLDVRNLEVKYQTDEGILTAIRNVSFKINPGEIVGVVGESGCGKSTVASAVLRLLPANGAITAGEISYKGNNIINFDDEKMRSLRGKELSMIFQDPMTSLNPVFSIGEQLVDAILAHPDPNTPLSRKAALEFAVEMIEKVGIPDAAKRIQDYPHQFSGGMRQRILIAMALLGNPAILVADEPTSALDVTLEAQIVDLIRKLRDEFGTSILYITHDLGVLAQLCDQVLVMYAGSVVESGDVFDIYKHPQHPYTRALLSAHPAADLHTARLATIPGRVPSLRNLPQGCKFSPRCAVAEEICNHIEPKEVLSENQRVVCHAYHEGWSGQDPASDVISHVSAVHDVEAIRCLDKNDVIVRTHRLQTFFEDKPSLIEQLFQRKTSAVRAVDNVDIEVCKGETFALVGESGSGKTTIGRTILRLVDSTGGEVIIKGQDITNATRHDIRLMRSNLQMIFQDPFSSLSPRKKVSSILLEPFQIHKIPVEKDQKVDELLQMVGLSSEQADKYPHQLSGGQARRVGIARALALNPEVLIADEPTCGLDVSVAAGILNLLKDLRERLDLTYIIITHNLNVIRFIADRVGVMYLGKIVELAESEDLFTRLLHPYTEALMSAFSHPDPTLRNSSKRIILEGEIPSPRNPPPGCSFHTRCRYAQENCAQVAPTLGAIGTNGQMVACHYPLKFNINYTNRGLIQS